ncbi:hypothetical protein PREVCOP_05646 [Segatella copri DSM 18205]|uniref:Uncharacterized protein n=1 Tax=Segatella copri DSM 18205 TaxID=537011 RepID=D1PEJ6_9BACT|nr:hypothetical protein PREVCOP_05646 [Segatella copri DSM 18205]
MKNAFFVSLNFLKELFFLNKYLLELKEVLLSHRRYFLLVGCFWQLKCKN